jgi:CheY-like chemotaxis protein
MARVLIVDDNPDFGPLLEPFLKKAGHEVQFAFDGAEALEKAGETDIVLLDIHLPLIDGIEVFRRLRAEPKTAALPVIFVTGSSSDAPDGARVRKLRKPFLPELLASMILELLKP